MAAGEGDLAISNTYYLGNLIRSENPDDRAVAEQICVVFPNQDGRGTHVNISGGGVAANAPNPEAAKLFLEYLASDSAQAYFAEGNSEYPVVEGVAAPEWIETFGAFKEDRPVRRDLRAEQRRRADDHGPGRLEVMRRTETAAAAVPSAAATGITKDGFALAGIRRGRSRSRAPRTLVAATALVAGLVLLADPVGGLEPALAALGGDGASRRDDPPRHPAQHPHRRRGSSASARSRSASPPHGS